MPPTDTSRRRFLQLAVTGAACFSLGNSLTAWGAAPRLALDDPQAKALGYVEDAGKITTAKEAAYKAVYPLTRKVIGFDAMTVRLNGDRFIARLERSLGHFSVGHEFQGRLRRVEGMILTGVAL